MKIRELILDCEKIRHIYLTKDEINIEDNINKINELKSKGKVCLFISGKNNVQDTFETIISDYSKKKEYQV